MCLPLSLFLIFSSFCPPVLACPLIPPRCHPCYCQDFAPGGLFIQYGWTLMDDYTSTARVIRTTDKIAHNRMIICPPGASTNATSHVFTCSRLFAQERLREERKERLSVPPPVCSLSFCLHSAFWVSIHQSDKVSLCVRMKDQARQIEVEGK